MPCTHRRHVLLCPDCGKRRYYKVADGTDPNTRSSQCKCVEVNKEPRGKQLETTSCVEHEEKKLHKCRPGGAVLGAEPERKKLKEAQCAAKKIAEPERSSTARVPSQCEPMMQSNQIPPTPVSWIAEPERKKLKKAQSAPW